MGAAIGKGVSRKQYMFWLAFSFTSAQVLIKGGYCATFSSAPLKVLSHEIWKKTCQWKYKKMVTSIKFASFNVQDIKYCLFRVFFLDFAGIQIERVSVRVNQVGYLQACKMLGMI